MAWLVRLLAAVWLVGAVPAFADSWSLPERTTYLSPDKTTRFTVIPRDLTNQLAYFSDRVDDKAAAGQRGGGEPRARGIVERRVGRVWTKLWEAPLRNDVAPVSALVANGGGHVVTFDNWHSVGFGENVVVLYRGDGSVVRSMQLTDIVPEDYVRALPHSVSSIWWGGEHMLSSDGRRVIVKVAIAGDGAARGDARGYLDVPIDLDTGVVGALAGPAWERAMAAAAPLAALSKAGEAAWRAEMLAPLTAPTGSDAAEWRRYLHQARLRMAAQADREVPVGREWILPAASDPAFAAQAKDIRDMLAAPREAVGLAFVSPAAPDDLARFLIAEAQALGGGKLTGTRIVIALPDRLAEGVRSAFAPTGATVFLFDPAVPIPQRAERLRELGATPETAAAEAARAAAQARGYEQEAARLGMSAPPEPRPAKAAANEDLEEMADRLEALADEAATPAPPRPGRARRPRR